MPRQKSVLSNREGVPASWVYRGQEKEKDLAILEGPLEDPEAT
ncbi:hypothetical protein SYN65AY640_12270 [Synechococcus sp. 65AY640]|nr:hypothetical protein SYN65AY640_12270 [Synechococcus sp. 65AY640]